MDELEVFVEADTEVALIIRRGAAERLEHLPDRILRPNGKVVLESLDIHSIKKFLLQNVKRRIMGETKKKLTRHDF